MLPDTRVFLSHSSKDKPFARRMARDLKRYGATVWFDEASIRLGETWRQELTKGIAENDFVVLLLSPASAKSEWVRYEVRQALAQGNKEGRVKLIPVLYESCEVPRELQRLQLLDFTGQLPYEQSLKRLIDSLARSWQITRHQRKPWTKKNLELALRGGILREYEGRLVFGARVAERSRTYGARWLRGRAPYGSKRLFADWREYSGTVMLHAIDKGAGLTAKQEVAVAHEAHERLLDFYLDLATRAGILDEESAVLKLSKEMGATVEQWIPSLEEYGFLAETGGEPRAALTILFVELIRERLIDRMPELSSFAEAIGIVIHDAFGFWTGWNEQPPASASATGAARRRRKTPRQRPSSIA